MEINHDAQEGLHLCGESVRIPEKSFKKLVEIAFDIILEKKDETSFEASNTLDSVNPGTLKEAYYGLVTLVIEAVKTDSSITDISTYLEECKWDSDRIEFFNKVFSGARPHIQALLSSTRTVFPHIVDVDWRLDYYVKNKYLDKVNNPTYLISLKTEESSKNGYSDVQFSCSMEQLQDLVGKLKDACKSLEKASQM